MTFRLGERLSEIRWTSETSFTLDGVPFALSDLGVPPTAAGFGVMKPRACFDAYRAALGALSVENMMELGIRHGGSAVLFATLLHPVKLVAIDISRPIGAFEAFKRDHPGGPASSIAAYFETSQDDEAALSAILEREMDGPLDLVVDDASHDYEMTKASFEILFPRLRPGGWYVIEDWQWAHTKGFWEWVDQPALSNLVFQLMMVCAGLPQLVAKVQVLPTITFIRKGESEPSRDRLNLEALCWMQNRTFTLL